MGSGNPFGCGCCPKASAVPALKAWRFRRLPAASTLNVSIIFITGTCRVQHVMSLLQYAGRLFSVDTLDTRFTTSSKTPSSRIDPARPSPAEAGFKSPGQGRNGGEDIAPGSSPPRWKSLEFIYHGLVFLVIVPLMFKTVYQVSQRKHTPSLSETPSLTRSLMFHE